MARVLGYGGLANTNGARTFDDGAGNPRGQTPQGPAEYDAGQLRWSMHNSRRGHFTPTYVPFRLLGFLFSWGFA